MGVRERQNEADPGAMRKRVNFRQNHLFARRARLI
jgi:hypothetical protein